MWLHALAPIRGSKARYFGAINPADFACLTTANITYSTQTPAHSIFNSPAQDHLVALSGLPILSAGAWKIGDL